jgi:hypothetical protein
MPWALDEMDAQLHRINNARRLVERILTKSITIFEKNDFVQFLV